MTTLRAFAETEPRILLDCRNALGESPVWDDRRNLLWWVDTMRGRIHWLAPDSGANGAHEMGEMDRRGRIAEPDDETGRPDGAAADALGRYWSAGVSASRLNIWDRDGALLGSVPIPGCPKPTMPYFGGPDMRSVFVTGHRNQMTPEVLAALPHAGSLFTFRASVAGARVARFADAAAKVGAQGPART